MSPEYSFKRRDSSKNKITYLPSNKQQFDIIHEWAQDLIDQGYLPSLDSIGPVLSFISQVCGECFKETGLMSKTRSKNTPYDEFFCTKCEKHSNRHSNSAQVGAILLQNQIQNRY